jgi:hypothetical protein
MNTIRLVAAVRHYAHRAALVAGDLAVGGVLSYVIPASTPLRPLLYGLLRADA